MATPEFVSRMKEAVGHIKAAQKIFNKGPLDYYLAKLVHQSEALLTRFAPIATGERAKIVEPIDFTGGWKGSEKSLALGASGVVTDVDYFDGGFVYTFVPDVQLYRTYEGKWKDCSSPGYSYMLREKYLAKEDTQ